MLWSILNLICMLSSDGCSFIQNLSCYLPLVSPFLKGRVVYAVWEFWSNEWESRIIGDDTPQDLSVCF